MKIISIIHLISSDISRIQLQHVIIQLLKYFTFSFSCYFFEIQCVHLNLD